jgi:hypothetical protein
LKGQRDKEIKYEFSGAKLENGKKPNKEDLFRKFLETMYFFSCTVHDVHKSHGLKNPAGDASAVFLLYTAFFMSL